MDELEAYAILELPLGADTPAVKGAFRRLSKRYHPDKHSEDNQDWAAQNFRRVKEAYELVLALAAEQDALEERSRLDKLRRLAVGEDGTLQESVLLALQPELCLDVGAWGKEPPFYSRFALKLRHAVPKLELAVYKSDDFENLKRLESAQLLGRLELADPPPSVTVLTKIDAQGQVKISLLGEHRFLDFEWREP